MKKILSLILAGALAFSFIGCGSSESKKEDKSKVETKQKIKNEKSKEEKKESLKQESKKDNVTIKRENLVGKSEKDFKELTKNKPNTVRNDVTGNWRLTTLSASCQIEKYALSYYKNNFKSKNEIHGIVNFTNNTTTRISDIGEFIEVVINEYVKGEEHDAKKLFGGKKLKHYWVYKDNGDVQEIK